MSVWLIVPPAESHRTRSDRRFGEVGEEWFDAVRVCSKCDSGDETASVRRRALWWLTGESRHLGDGLWSNGGAELFLSRRVRESLGSVDGALFVSGRVEERVRDRRTEKPGAVLSPSFLSSLREYAELRVTARAPIDLGRSSLVFADERAPCVRCGRFQITWEPPKPSLVEPDYPLAALQGVEWFEVGDTWYPGRGPDIIRRPRAQGQGAVFRRADLAGAEVWRASQDDSFTLCNDDFRQRLLAAEPTNIDFLEVGSIVD